MMIQCLLCLALTTWQDYDDAARQSFKRGDLAEAESDWRESLRLAELGSNVEPGMVTALTGLALVNEQQGHYSESERLYELAMRNLEQALGRQSAQFAAYMPNLGYVYQKHGKTQQAEDLFTEFLATTEKVYGKVSPEMANAFDAYAEYLKRAGRHVESANASQQARNIRSKLSGN
jgi:tetratricopeptide (TPR) repeat protein